MKQGMAPGLAGLVGGMLFLLFFFVIIPDDVVVAIIAALVGLVAGWLIFAKGLGRSGRAVDGAAESRLAYDKLALAEKLRQGWDYHKKLKDLARQAAGPASNPTVRAKIEAIADVVARILRDVQDDPADLPKTTQFFDYYLVATVAVVAKYLDLQGKASTPEGVQALRGVEATLDTVKAAFEKLLQQPLENNVMDLDVELKVLNNTISMEGLGVEPGEVPPGGKRL